MAIIKNLLIKLGVKGARRSTKVIGGVTNGLKGLAKEALKAGAVFYGAKGIIEGIKHTAQISGQLKGVEVSFKNLAKGIGGTGDTLGKLQKATGGTVSNLDLMTQANNAMLLSVFESNDQMAEAFDIAQRLGTALGKDTLFGVESLVTGMGRQSKMMLDNLGIMIDIDEANENYAKANNLSASSLTDQQKKLAFNNETMRKARELVENLGEKQFTTSQRIDILKASATNMAGVIGTALTPAFNKSLDVMADFSVQISNTVNALSKIDFKATGENILKNTDALLTAFRDTFTAYIDFLPDYWNTVFGKIFPIAKNILNKVLELVKAVGSFIWQPIKVGAEIMGAKVKNIFINMFNAIKEQFNSFADSWVGEKMGIEKLGMTDLIDIESLETELENTDFMKKLFGGEDQIQTLAQFTDRQKEIWSTYFNAVKETAEESSDKIKKSTGAVTGATEKNTTAVKKMSIESAISAGQSADSAASAARSIIKTYIAQGIAAQIKETLAKIPPPISLVAAGVAAAGASALFDKLIPKFAEGGIVQGAGKQDTVPAMLTPGEVVLNQAQQENLIGGMGTTINIQGGVVDESYVNNQLIPALNKATSLGARLNA
jgi:hypothetical protein